MDTLERIISGGAAAVISFLVLFLLGAVPFLPSPIDRLQASMSKHDQHSEEILKTLRAICYRLPDNIKISCE